MSKFMLPSQFIANDNKEEGKVYLNLSFKIGDKKVNLVLNTELTCQKDKGSKLQRALISKLINLPDGKLPEKLLQSMEVEIFHTHEEEESHYSSDLEDLFK